MITGELILLSNYIFIAWDKKRDEDMITGELKLLSNYIFIAWDKKRD